MILAILLAASVAERPNLQRQDRQDTIYTVSGRPEALTAFQQNVGAAWTGGTVVDDDPSDGSLTYWAYTDRTAAEARALMVPAIMTGLKLGITRSVEAVQFPTERERLDRVAISCGAVIDPFFVTPKRTVEIDQTADADSALRKCLVNGVKPLPVTVHRQDQTAK